MPNTGGVTITASCPAVHSALTSRSMASSLPRPISSCSAAQPYSDASLLRKAGGCGSG
jgi:hypothetical protein